MSHRLRAASWRIPLVLAGVAMALGGSQHPEGDAEESLRDELATMTSSSTWVLSHTLLAIGAALLATGLVVASRTRTWPASTRPALRIATTAMSLYVVETVFHLASVVDADALADGRSAPVATTHIGLALLLYPISGLAFAWLNVRLLRVAVPLPVEFLGVVGVVAGLLHATSVPSTIIFPDTELSPMFAGAGMLFALWSLGIGLVGVGATRDRTKRAAAASPSIIDPESASARPGLPTQGDNPKGTSYRAAERRLWSSLGVDARERFVELRRLGTQVRVQEIGDGEPVVFVHGGPSAGTTWAPLVAEMAGFRSIVVDRPGTGLSPSMSITAAELGGFADSFVVDLLDALELERAPVVASSFGGFLALRAAALAPERFERMVQMACPAGAPGMAVPGFMRAATIPPLRKLMTTLPPNERMALSMLRQIGHGTSVDAGRFTPAFLDWYLSLQRDTATARHDLRLIGSLVTVTGSVRPALALPRDLLRHVDVPTYFYWGADDPFGGLAVAESMVQTMPDAHLDMVADAGHLPWLDDPSAAGLAIRAFLRSGTTPDPSVRAARA
ncbi:MAG: alpha/beta hydrolase [Acidimicrobiales bacterium]|nr:alpha/beta hydrolase [Acidimicrobiales bacterium]MCB9393303.1 alpha/beta hydrolase [Acidimicrobiaceae bacterium]